MSFRQQFVFELLSCILVLICCPAAYNDSSTRDSISAGFSLLPQAPDCGRISSANRTVDGVENKLGEFSVLALIEYTKPGNIKGYYCVGTLISNRYVLTAAHCISDATIPKDWRVTGIRLGESDTTTNSDFVADTRGRRDTALLHVDVGVEQMIVHDQFQFSGKNLLHDIALIRLNQNVEFNDYVQPVCLPTSSSFGSAAQEGAGMHVVVWSAMETNRTSTKKLKAEVNVWEWEKCKVQYGPSNLDLETPLDLQTSQMCAGGMLGADSCRFDSGGPLLVKQYVNNVSYYYLSGVVSLGHLYCVLTNYPVVYTRVSNYLDWIKSNVRT